MCILYPLLWHPGSIASELLVQRILYQRYLCRCNPSDIQRQRELPSGCYLWRWSQIHRHCHPWMNRYIFFSCTKYVLCIVKKLYPACFVFDNWIHYENASAWSDASYCTLPLRIWDGFEITNSQQTGYWKGQAKVNIHDSYRISRYYLGQDHFVQMQAI